MKKLLILFALLALSISPIHASSEVFPDVGTRNQAAIEFLHQVDVIQGYPDGTFRPRKPLNRAELLKVVMLGMGISPTAEYQNCFPDVKQEWFAGFVCYAKNQEWIAGYTDDTFRPDQFITKAEALKIIFNITGLTEAGVEGFVYTNGELFEDVTTAEWYSYYVYDAKDRGLLEQSVGKFYPANNITRGEFSEIVFRAIVSIINQEYKYSELSGDDIDSIAQNFISHKENGTLRDIKPVERTLTKRQAFDSLILLYEKGFEYFSEEFENKEYEKSLKTANSLMSIVDNIDIALDKIEEEGEENNQWIEASRQLNMARRNSIEKLVANNQELIDSVNALAELERQKEQYAQQLCEEYPDWTQEDCEDVTNGLIWVGMTYEMLIESVGEEPDHATPSNYGYGTEWQWCWDDYSPMCFYDTDDDGVIDAYN